MNLLKKYIYKNSRVHSFCLFYLSIVGPLSLGKFFKAVVGYFRYLTDLTKYFGMEKSERFKLFNLRPSLEDWIKTTSLDLSYFYQDTWAAEKVMKDIPDFHVDIGSTALLVGILSKITRVYSIDIRPLPVKLDNLECKKGSVLDLPFKDGEVSSLSSLCVIEHIGLGRYGDALDPWGSYKAISEISRVFMKGGNLYVSVPVGEEAAVYFNAYRVFEPQNFVALFEGFKMMSSLFILEDRLCTIEEYIKIDKFPYYGKIIVGCFHLRKV